MQSKNAEHENAEYWTHLLCELVSTSLSLVSSSMASLLVLLLSAGSSAHSLVLLLWSQPNDGPQ